MSCTQLAWSQVTPRIDIDAMTIGNADETLHLAHRRACALCLGIDQVDTGCEWRSRTRYTADRVSVLRLE